VGLRIGVVGCGYWGSKHVRVLREIPDVTQVVAIDASERIRSAIAESYPDVQILEDLRTAFAHIDALVIATPPGTHVPLGLSAIAAGKSVLIEKPLAPSTNEAKRLITAAAQRDVTLMAGHTFEYNAAVWKLKELIESGELGRICYIDAARLKIGRAHV
jgi:predicted dehydrogenase